MYFLSISIIIQIKAIEDALSEKSIDNSGQFFKQYLDNIQNQKSVGLVNSDCPPQCQPFCWLFLNAVQN